MKRFLLKVFLKIFLLAIIAVISLFIIPEAYADGCYIPQGSTNCASGTPPLNAIYTISPNTNCSFLPNANELCTVQGCCCDVLPPENNIIGNIYIQAYCDYLQGTSFNPLITNRQICQSQCDGTTLDYYRISGFVLSTSGIRQPLADITLSPGAIYKTSNANGFYEFTTLVGGQTYTLNANLSECSGTVTVPDLSAPTDINITLDNCCEYTCPDWNSVPCANGIKSRTCISPNGCADYIETQSCTIPACDWQCDAWTPADDVCIFGQAQTRNCIKIPDEWPIGECYGAPPMPLIQKTCTNSGSQTNLCGNGQIDPLSDEECDFNPSTGDFHTTCIPATIANCNYLDDCTCISTYEPAECEEDPNPPTSLSVTDIFRTRSFRLSWDIPTSPQNCMDYIEDFDISRCTVMGNAETCTNNFYPVVTGLAKTTEEYIHASAPPLEIQGKVKYCYNLTIHYNTSIIDPQKRTFTLLECEAAGEEECLAPTPAGWCIGNSQRICNNVEPLINEFSGTQCGGEVCSDNQPCIVGNCINGQCVAYCSMTTGTPTCDAESACDKCNSVLWMFGQQGYNVYLENGASQICPSISNRLSSGCYIDYTRTSVDMTFSCSGVTTCYNYTSKNTCEGTGPYSLDICQKFVVDGDNGCEWLPYSDSVYKGVCRPKDVSLQDCSLCNNPTHNRIYPRCTRDVCNIYGDCYFNASNLKCINGEDMVCAGYPIQSECTGTNDAFFKVDTAYDISGIRVSGTNAFINDSNDLMNIGRCRWIYSTNSCIKDADNSTINDCRMNINGQPELRKICERDIIPPTSNYVPATSYGEVMDLSGLAIIDNRPEWSITDNTSTEKIPYLRKGIWLYYCIEEYIIDPDPIHQGMGGPNSCYPRDVLVTTNTDPELNYKIFLEDYDEGEYLFRYFAEDPSKNLETIKEFLFTLDTTPPNIILSLDYDTYPTEYINPLNPDEYIWYTNLGMNIQLVSDNSLPVSCYLNMSTSGQWISGGPSALTLASLEANNIPTITSPDNTLISGESLTTTYSALEPGRYAYDLVCYDSVNNKYESLNNILNIDGDMTINDPKPMNITPPLKSFMVPQFMSINTSANGTCRYSASTTNYSLMTESFDEVIEVDTGTYLHRTEVDAPISELLDPPVYDTGIYRYYVACNLYINGNWKIITGSSADVIDFAIDENAPRTTLNYLNSESQYVPYVYNISQMNSSYTFELSCNDSQVELTDNRTIASGSEIVDRSFGCPSIYDDMTASYYCLKRNTTTSCVDGIYKEYNPQQGLFISYEECEECIEPEIIAQLGNRPYLCYYSIDNGGNQESEICTRINIQSTTFEPPIIIVIDTSIQSE